jgi:CheY-like chemotaxis protein
LDTEPKTQPGGPRRRILLVDDDQDLLETTAALLEDDFDVLTAASGEQALETLARASVAVVCADYKMPGMTGLDLLRAVRDRFPGRLQALRARASARDAARHHALRVDELGGEGVR